MGSCDSDSRRWFKLWPGGSGTHYGSQPYSEHYNDYTLSYETFLLNTWRLYDYNNISYSKITLRYYYTEKAGGVINYVY